jgi:hypothetical protein
MFIRRAESRQLLQGKNKKINMSLFPCGPHVWFYTQDGQHDWCLNYQLNDRKYRTAARPPTPPMSAALYVYPGDGEFTIGLRWQSDHAPYPEIEMITAGVFGVTIGPYSYPCGGIKRA